MTMFPSEQDKVWYELFKAALVGSANLNPDKAAERAAQIADDAMTKVQAHLKPKEPAEPLFNPLLREKAAQRQKDEADSSFAVAK
jgi:hypothetical protein